MKNYLKTKYLDVKIITIISMIFLGCKNHEPKLDYALPSNEDINQIIETIILNDNLAITKKDSSEFSVPIATELIQLKIFIPEKSKNYTPPPPPIRNVISIDKLLNSELVENREFVKNDSIYFHFQNRKLKNYTIDRAISNNLITTTFQEQNSKIHSNKLASFYYLTIPVFSADNKRAYIEITEICNDCGNSYFAILKKDNGEWKIIKEREIWTN